MGNAPWLSKWGRSPRQDRRVVENGKFVEQGQVHVPEPPVEEQELNTALEVVHEPANAGASTDGNVSPDAPQGESRVGLETSEGSAQSDSGQISEVVGVVPDASISTTEEQPTDEMKSFDAVAAHTVGSQTIAEIAEVLCPPETTEGGPDDPSTYFYPTT